MNVLDRLNCVCFEEIIWKTANVLFFSVNSLAKPGDRMARINLLGGHYFQSHLAHKK